MNILYIHIYILCSRTRGADSLIPETETEPIPATDSSLAVCFCPEHVVAEVQGPNAVFVEKATGFAV